MNLSKLKLEVKTLRGQVGTTVKGVRVTENYLSC